MLKLPGTGSGSGMFYRGEKLPGLAEGPGEDVPGDKAHITAHFAPTDILTTPVSAHMTMPATKQKHEMAERFQQIMQAETTCALPVLKSLWLIATSPTSSHSHVNTVRFQE